MRVSQHEEMKEWCLQHGLDLAHVNKLISSDLTTIDRITILEEKDLPRLQLGVYAERALWRAITSVVGDKCHTEQISNKALCSNTETKNELKTTAKLPKLEMPKFSGDILQWDTFWQLFEVNIHLQPGLPDSTKFSYLRCLLQDGAADVIKGLPLTELHTPKLSSV